MSSLPGSSTEAPSTDQSHIHFPAMKNNNLLNSDTHRPYACNPVNMFTLYVQCIIVRETYLGEM